MKNKELHADRLIDLVLSEATISVNKHTNIPVNCRTGSCANCLFYTDRCNRNSETLKSWGEKDVQDFWESVEIDTPILVRETESDEWLRRHFAYYRDGKVYAYVGGKSSYTSKVAPYGWEEAKIWTKEMEE